MKKPLVFLLYFTLLTGIIYPLVMTGLAQLLFPSLANGSIIYKNGKAVGSELIGQSFDSTAGYFTSRPSAVAYNPMPSGGSNYGLTSANLQKLFVQREINFRRNNNLKSTENIPPEMLFASGSGLDPHISQAAAFLQIDRICRTRGFSEVQKNELIKIIDSLTEQPQLRFLGNQRINVLVLNLETDKIK